MVADLNLLGSVGDLYGGQYSQYACSIWNTTRKQKS